MLMETMEFLLTHEAVSCSFCVFPFQGNPLMTAALAALNVPRPPIWIPCLRKQC